MKALWACLFISVATLVECQVVSKPTGVAPSNPTIADFGLIYPLSNDWIRATELWRRLESSNPRPNSDILLAAVYLPKSKLSPNSPFFLLRAYRQPATDCKKNLEAMIAAYSPDQKDNRIAEFTAAGRDYFRANFTNGVGGRHECIICTTANGHLLVWNTGAHNEKDLELIVATLNSITPLSQRSATDSTQSSGQKNDATEDTSSKPLTAQPEKVEISHTVAPGHVIRKVPPIYPREARAASIQGTVILQAVISKNGDIIGLELVDGPLELAGAAITAVRQWKYAPYLVLGQPVDVQTQIQVNFQLTPR